MWMVSHGPKVGVANRNETPGLEHAANLPKSGNRISKVLQDLVTVGDIRGIIRQGEFIDRTLDVLDIVGSGIPTGDFESGSAAVDTNHCAIWGDVASHIRRDRARPTSEVEQVNSIAEPGEQERCGTGRGALGVRAHDHGIVTVGIELVVSWHQRSLPTARYGAATVAGMTDQLTHLEPGMAVLYGGNRVAHVTPELADAFQPGDHLIVVQSSGDLLHVSASVHQTATEAVTAAARGFRLMGGVSDEQITAFYREFAARLADDNVFSQIALANESDVEAARQRGRSTTRLVLSARMRQDMIDGLKIWQETASVRDQVLDSIAHEGWQVDLMRSGLGIVGFIFEGRPNVFADATGVLRSGNAVVFRIGSDALGTARAIVKYALTPAITAAGLPDGIVSLVDSPARAAGWALFSDPRLALAVARGSGGAVGQLGAVARQAGIPVSLHGTGGAWIVTGVSADAAKFGAAVENSLDRKVCNTLNTCCILESRAAELVPVFLDALDRAGQNSGVNSKLHITANAKQYVPEEWFSEAAIGRAEGDVVEPRTELIDADRLGVEWEWETSPEVTLTIVPDQGTAAGLFNEQSPRFGASLIAESTEEHDQFWATVDAPFVGNGFTRWIDGQYALNRPELGLSNWQGGRLFGRAGVLSGDSVYTVRTRATQSDPALRR